jgi:hypothetical protein
MIFDWDNAIAGAAYDLAGKEGFQAADDHASAQNTPATHRRSAKKS